MIVADCGVGSPVKVNCGSAGAVDVAGRPEVLIETTPVKPFTGVTVTVYTTGVPGRTVCADAGVTLNA